MTSTDPFSEIDSCCDRFEACWIEQESPPDLGEFLPLVSEANRQQLFRELVLVDVEYRRKNKFAVPWEEWRLRFPEFDAIVHELRRADATAQESDAPPATPRKKEAAGLAETVTLAEPNRVTKAADPTKRERVGRYQVLQELGRGGQGFVYRAVHPTLPIEVAIKIGRGHLSDGERETMRQEAEALCALDHPGIARIRDLDCDEQGRPFLVLDFIRGQTLRQLLQSPARTTRRLAECVAAAADAVGYAHRRGVLHLDLKPANIVLDENGRPKVIDFGMARLRHLWKEAADEPDRVSGTPQYMAPEQAGGLSKDIAPLSDVFSLGAILYHVITGHAPFEASTSEAALHRASSCDVDWTRLEAAVESGEPSLRRLADVCRTALSAEVAKRHENAEAFAAAVRDAVDEPAPPADQSRRFLMVASAAVLLPLLGAFGVYLLPAESNIPSPPVDLPVSDSLIERFDVTHIGNSVERAEFSDALLRRRPALVDDDIKVRVGFSQPAYFYLVALNPDGTVQLCFPERDDHPQAEPISELRYPPAADTAFGLTDGVGQQALVVVASREPLPSFRKWWDNLRHVPWPHPELNGNWIYRGGRMVSLGAESAEGSRERGAIRKLKSGAGFQELCEGMEVGPVADVAGVAFEVNPR